MTGAFTLKSKQKDDKMSLNEKQLEELGEAAKPLMKFLNEHCNPHTHAIVETNSVEVAAGIACIKNDEFVKD